MDRGLVESRSRAQALIMAGLVYSKERKLEKAGQQVAGDIALEVRGQDHPWVSRGGLKLAHAIEHFGITAPGRAGEAVEDARIALGGRSPVNPSGGLIGLGHPVGATGVRMALDAARQVEGRAGDCQVENARNVATYNVGGSATANVSLVIGR